MILSKLIIPGRFNLNDYLQILLKQGLTRIEVGKDIQKIPDIPDHPPKLKEGEPLYVIIDRVVVSSDSDAISRIADSVQTAFSIGKGTCIIEINNDTKPVREAFSNKFEADGMEFEEPSVHLFSFNNPIGACPLCEGYGKIIGIDENLVIPNKNLSIYEDTVVCWRGEKMKKWKERLIRQAPKFDFPVHKPYYLLSENEKQLLWTGNRYFWGLNTFFKYLEKKKYKIQYRVMLSRYRGKTTCPECKGTRLRKEASYVKINRKSVPDLVTVSIEELDMFFKKLKINSYEKKVADRILVEIRSRIDFLIQVGLGYLTLNRLSASLSGGESQRINLATSLGSSLVGSLYILDEPSIGLHARDTHKLIGVLEHLRDLGNTVLVVEHDEEIIKAADEIIDIGPKAGRLGGYVVFQGNYKKMLKEGNSLTAEYLKGDKCIPLPEIRRKWNSYIEIRGAREHNLKNLNIKIPLNIMTVITGVSGSGKSSLVGDILFPALSKLLSGSGGKTGDFDTLTGDIDRIDMVDFVDQNPIGKSSRSNPATYLKVWDEIRKLYADQPLSKINHFNPSHFSFNIDGGRCETCQGEGIIRVEMQFMADVELICESCQGKRFKDEILEVRYHDKNIYDIMELTVNEAIVFFGSQDESHTRKISRKLRPLEEVGLGYIKLGQSSSTLSGGESQRVKLAFFLSKEGNHEHHLFIFDEPTTGLHFHDIRKLLDSFQALMERGHSILIIEHHPDIIKSADWVIDLGPDGGEKGGCVVASGTPEEIMETPSSYTGRYLSKKLKREVKKEPC